jgi:hypothetical protein
MEGSPELSKRCYEKVKEEVLRRKRRKSGEKTAP